MSLGTSSWSSPESYLTTSNAHLVPSQPRSSFCFHVFLFQNLLGAAFRFTREAYARFIPARSSRVRATFTGRTERTGWTKGSGKPRGQQVALNRPDLIKPRAFANCCPCPYLQNSRRRRCKIARYVASSSLADQRSSVLAVYLQPLLTDGQKASEAQLVRPSGFVFQNSQQHCHVLALSTVLQKCFD